MDDLPNSGFFVRHYEVTIGRIGNLMFPMDDLLNSSFFIRHCELAFVRIGNLMLLRIRLETDSI